MSTEQATHGPQPDAQKIESAEIMTSRSFLRFCSCLSAYQETLATATPEDRPKIIERMHKIHSYADPFDLVIEPALTACEEGTFSPKNLAELIAGNSHSPELEGIWHPETSEMTQGYRLIDSPLYYHQTSPDTIDLHISPNTYSATEQSSRLIAAFQTLKRRIADGTIACTSIKLRSWLLAPPYNALAKRLLGAKKIEKLVTLVDRSLQKEYEQVMALTFNPRPLKKYLVSGQKPEIGEFVITPEELNNLV